MLHIMTYVYYKEDILMNTENVTQEMTVHVLFFPGIYSHKVRYFMS
jgi:hypothetical protein